MYARARVTFLDEPTTADAFLTAIQGAELLALDTEGATFHRYFDRTWLVQVATRDRSAVLDPIRAGKMAGLAALLASPQTEVVLHDAGNDLRLLRQDFSWQVTRIFDTRIAAQLLGIKAFGLGSLLGDLFGVKLDKKQQRADWSQRPLSQDMLDYAAQDTAHLLALRDRMKDDLVKAARLAWAMEEFAALERPLAAGDEAIPADDDDAKAPAYLRITGARELSSRSLTFLRDLVAWRDGIAKSRDKAPFRVIGNEQLLALAVDPPKTKDDLARIRGAQPALLRQEGDALVAIAATVRALPDAELAAFPRQNQVHRDPALEARAAKLKAVRDATAARLKIDPGFLCGRARLDKIARANPRTLAELAATDGVRRWNVEVMGEAVVAALHPR